MVSVRYIRDVALWCFIMGSLMTFNIRVRDVLGIKRIHRVLHVRCLRSRDLTVCNVLAIKKLGLLMSNLHGRRHERKVDTMETHLTYPDALAIIGVACAVAYFLSSMVKHG